MAASLRRNHGSPAPSSQFCNKIGRKVSSIEVGIIGREGMTGISLILKHDEPVQNEVYMQMGGGGWRIPSAKLASAIDASASLHQLMLNFAHAFYLQATKTALANGSSKIEERLARWLLMADDRVGGDMPLTQEFLAMMLGVRRAGVAVAIQELERRGLISRRRAGVRVVDRASLVALSEDTYQPPFKP